MRSYVELGDGAEKGEEEFTRSLADHAYMTISRRIHAEKAQGAQRPKPIRLKQGMTDGCSTRSYSFFLRSKGYVTG